MTKTYTIHVKNCKFDNLIGPNDGTVLVIDEDSKKFIESKSKKPIEGFNEVIIYGKTKLQHVTTTNCLERIANPPMN